MAITDEKENKNTKYLMGNEKKIQEKLTMDCALLCFIKYTRLFTK